jgi:hypothetical protein
MSKRTKQKARLKGYVRRLEAVITALRAEVAALKENTSDNQRPDRES